MFHEEPARAALDELDAESIQTRKKGVGRCHERYLSSTIHLAEQPAIRERDLDDSREGSPERGLLLVGADVPRENLGCDRHLVFQFIGSLADPVRQTAFVLVADELDHLGIGEQFGPDRDDPGPCIRRRIRESDLDLAMAEVGAALAFRRVQRLRVGMAIMIEPRTVVESETLHNQRVPLPMPD